MTEWAMADQGNVGERNERAARNRRLGYYAALVATGFAVGFVFALAEGKGGWSDDGIPSLIAIILAIVTFGAMFGGSLLIKRRTDEVEWQNNLFAGAMATFVVVLGYPVWFLLWRGGLVPEPSHIVMFATLYLVLGGAYLFRKLRQTLH